MSAVVIGVGNPYRRDDGVGPAIVDALRQRGVGPAVLAECDGEPSRLLDLWAGTAMAVVVDAVYPGTGMPGTVHRHTLPPPGPSGAGHSHAMDFGDTVALAAALDRLPAVLLLFAVEAADVSLGVGLSPEVAAAVPVVVDEIAELLGATACA
jgi:hydrogenase maturation protease